MLTIISALILYFVVQSVFDPNASITINGITATNQSSKIFALAFCALFPILGLFFAFVPEKHLAYG